MVMVCDTVDHANKRKGWKLLSGLFESMEQERKVGFLDQVEAADGGGEPLPA